MPDNDSEQEAAAPMAPPASEVRKVARRAARKSTAAQDVFESKFALNAIDSEAQYTHLMGVKDHYYHKGAWSYFLMLIMLMMIVFQSLLLGLVGSRIWDFKEYKWLLPALLAQNLAQIVGLAIFVVRSLFREVKSH